MLHRGDLLASAFQRMQVRMYHGFLLGALLLKRHISRLERGCPNTKMLASSCSTSSLIIIIIVRTGRGGRRMLYRENVPASAFQSM